MDERKPSKERKEAAVADTTDWSPEGAGSSGGRSQRSGSEREGSSGAADKARDAAAEGQKEARSMKESGKEVMQQATETAGEVTEQTREQLSRMAEERKNRAADAMERFARVMRKTSDTLHEEDVDEVARYSDKAADRIERLSDYLRRTDLDTMMSNTEDFARRRPEIFFGGLALAGLTAGRFLRSSSPEGSAKYAGAGRSGSPGSRRLPADRSPNLPDVQRYPAGRDRQTRSSTNPSTGGSSVGGSAGGRHDQS